MSRRTSASDLSPAQQDEAERILAILHQATATDLRALAEQLARTTDRTIFGANEFIVRDLVLGIGAKAIAAALEERKKGGTTGRAASAAAAANRPSSSAGSRSGS